jgi:hypothetical protein
VVAAFEGGTMTSEAGAMLLGASDQQIRLIERFAGCFTDYRDADLVVHVRLSSNALPAMRCKQGRAITKPEVGSPVFVSARDLPVRAGCYAEYIAVPAAAAHLLPPGCELEAAACLSNY